MKVTIRKPHERYRSKPIDCSKDKRLVEQSHKDECDINKILRSHTNQSLREAISSTSPQYGEHTSFDLHEAMNVVTEANTMFESLPSKIRDRFENDPGNYLDFVNDPENREEMYTLGMAVRPKPEPPKAQNPETGVPPKGNPEKQEGGLQPSPDSTT